MSKRDLLKDLELCNKATQGPWKMWVDEDSGDHVITLGDKHEAHTEIVYDHCCWYNGNLPDGCPANLQAIEAEHNAMFIAESREGWPHAIERAIQAEGMVEELLKLLNAVVKVLEKHKEEAQEDIALWTVRRVITIILHGTAEMGYGGDPGET